MMALHKLKIKKVNQINTAWWINDWSSKSTDRKEMKTINITQEYPSNIILNSSLDSIEMLKTKYFLNESLKSSKGPNGTIIIGTTVNNTVPELHEILLNIQPLGWIYIPGGSKK